MTKLHRLLFYIFFISSIASTMTLAAKKEEEGPKAHLYRYKNAQGNTAISKQIPPEFYKYGYEALDKRGRVIEIVPPAPSEQEQEKISKEQKAKRQALLQEKKDQQLLKTYSSAKDAIRVRDRKTSQIDVMIQITEAKISALRSDHDREVANAASLEREGKAVPEKSLAIMERLETQISEFEEYIKEKEQEKTEITTKYDRAIMRLKKISEKQPYSNTQND